MHQQVAPSTSYFHYQCSRQQQQGPCCSSCFLFDSAPSTHPQASVPENQTYHSPKYARQQTFAEFHQTTELQEKQDCSTDDVRLRSRRWNLYTSSPSSSSPISSPIALLLLAIWHGPEKERPTPKANPICPATRRQSQQRCALVLPSVAGCAQTQARTFEEGGGYTPHPSATQGQRHDRQEGCCGQAEAHRLGRVVF